MSYLIPLFVAVVAGLKPLAQKIKKYVQKVRGFKEKGKCVCVSETMPPVQQNNLLSKREE